MRSVAAEPCATCQGLAWIAVRTDEVKAYRTRWFGARLVPGLNDCPACVQVQSQQTPSQQAPEFASGTPSRSEHDNPRQESR